MPRVVNANPDADVPMVDHLAEVLTPKYTRVVLKISGEGFGHSGKSGISIDETLSIARQAQRVQQSGVQLAIVVGAGNILRGAQFSAGGEVIKQPTAHYMGMLATVLNGMALQDALESLRCETRLLTAIRMESVAEPYIRRRAIRHLEKGRIVILAGGTPTFPVFARQNWPGLEYSPGTLVLHDHGYGSKYGEMSGITPAALLFTRVISRPTPRRITLDLGYKAVASDPPAGKRCILLNVPDYEAVLQSEEHFAVETPAAERFQPGDAVYAMPTHVCPTCAMHRFAHVVDDGKIVDRWEIVARDRVLSI